MLYKRARALVASWEYRGLCVRNYGRGTRGLPLTPEAFAILDKLTDWQNAADLQRLCPEVSADTLASTLAQLIDSALVESLAAPASEVEQGLHDWRAWGLSAALFHLDTKDVPFQDITTGPMRMDRRLLIDPPPPRGEGTVSIELPAYINAGAFPEVLLERRSWRRFGDRPLALAELSTLLGLTWGTQAWMQVRDELACPLKTSPSGGALHSLEVYVHARGVRGLPTGMYRYAPDAHGLIRVDDLWPDERITQSLAGQDWAASAGAVFFMTAVFPRVQWKYKFGRAYRAILLEAGHFCQTFLLTATWLQLAPFCTAALADTQIEQGLGVDGISESVIYAMGAGPRPAGATWAPWPDAAAPLPEITPPAHQRRLSIPKRGPSVSTENHAVRRQFDLKTDISHFATLVFASHPTTVANAIEYYRDILDADGYRYFQRDSPARKADALQAAARYFGMSSPGLVALTTGTTLGLAQILGGITMKADQHCLISTNEHDATTDTLGLRCRREGRDPREAIKKVVLFADSRTATRDEVVQNIKAAITEKTRVLSLAWVYSSDGVKLPIADIARIVDEVNRTRSDEADRLLFVVDGVHGFGVEDVNFSDLGCDFFIAGTHKAIFGPRGTGVIYGKEEAWPAVVPWIAVLASKDNAKNPAWDHIPGGVRAYEHQWAMGKAFSFHLNVLRKANVQSHVRALATSFRAQLEQTPGITIVTPSDPEMASGLICLDVDDYTASQVVDELESHRVVASTSAPDAARGGASHVRFGLSILTTEADISRAMTTLRGL